jgi:hypothetical protein
MSMAILLLDLAAQTLSGLYKYLNPKEATKMGSLENTNVVNNEITSVISFRQFIATIVIFTFFSCILGTLIWLVILTSSNQPIELTEVTGTLDRYYHHYGKGKNTTVTFVLKDGSVYSTSRSLDETKKIFSDKNRKATIIINKNPKLQKDGSRGLLGLIVNDQVILSHKDVLHEKRRSNEITSKVLLFVTICFTPTFLCILIPSWKDYIWKYIKQNKQRQISTPDK